MPKPLHRPPGTCCPDTDSKRHITRPWKTTCRLPHAEHPAGAGYVRPCVRPGLVLVPARRLGTRARYRRTTRRFSAEIRGSIGRSPLLYRNVLDSERLWLQKETLLLLLLAAGSLKLTAWLPLTRTRLPLRPFFRIKAPYIYIYFI